MLAQDARARLELKESPEKGVFVKDLTLLSVRSVQEMDTLMLRGTLNRSVGETAMNKDSSRSHCIFTVHVETSEQLTNA